LCYAGERAARSDFERLLQECAYVKAFMLYV
jgi:hypothetical protein